MIQTDSNQLFYIYNDVGVKIGVKERYTVHRSGDWHRAVQLNLINGFLLLMQQRSNQVDIAKGLFDQTLATQLITTDKEDDINAISRGLWEELGIDIRTLSLKHIAGPRKIIKRYEYDDTLYNREFVSLYQAYFPKQDLTPTHPKVRVLFWKPIDEVKKDAIINPKNYTKTFLMWLKEVM